LNSAVFQRANDFLVQSGVRAGGKILFVAFVGTTIFLFGFLGLILGYNIETFVGASLVGAFAIFAYFKMLRQKRRARFSALLPETVDVVVRGIRVGYPLPAALNLVAREMPDPIGTEFGIVADEIAFGQDIRTAIGNLYRRVGQDDLLLLIMAINIQSQTGGNLAEILSGLSRLLRSRSKIRMKIKALSADGRMSAIVLSVIPFVLFGGICLISPSYFAEIRHHPLVGPALAYAAISLILGNIVMYRMVNFKF
jgi:tight adherence protein B